VIYFTGDIETYFTTGKNDYFFSYVLGTGEVWESCPLGTFSTNTGLWSADMCTPCTGGYYCDTTNATAVTGPCNAGYYCTEGKSRDEVNCQMIFCDPSLSGWCEMIKIFLLVS